MIPGHSTETGTARYAARFASARGSEFYRPAQDLTVASLGCGTYLGGLDDETTRGYKEALMTAVRSGINFIDTSLNYRHQRSEQAVEQALGALIGGDEIKRDEVVVCTKAGFLVPNAVPTAALRATDVVGGMHSMAPAFLKDQLGRSLVNLGLAAVDVFYLHNPETQLRYVPGDEFYARIRQAFAALEELSAQGKIRYYGTATWDGYRVREGGMSLARIVELAREVAGDAHRFRFIQLPFNLAMPEGREAAEAASHAGLTVVASATLLQGRLAQDLPRAIQFTRSAPGITVALVGMSQRAHVAQNLAAVPV